GHAAPLEAHPAWAGHPHAWAGTAAPPEAHAARVTVRPVEWSSLHTSNGDGAIDVPRLTVRAGLPQGLRATSEPVAGSRTSPWSARGRPSSQMPLAVSASTPRARASLCLDNKRRCQ